MPLRVRVQENVFFSFLFFLRLFAACSWGVVVVRWSVGVRRDHDTREGPSAAPWATSQRIPTPIILTVAYHSPLVMGDGEIASPANESEKDERSFAVSVRSKKQHRRKEECVSKRFARGEQPASCRQCPPLDHRRAACIMCP